MKENKRFTTVNTDAGLKDGKAYFAYWIRSEDITFNNARPFKIPIISSNEAELAAMISALNIVANTPYLRSADILIVNCDNISALKALRDNNFRGRSGHFEKYATYYHKIMDKLPKKRFFRHVKGHKRIENSREWVNDWCDKEIRKFYK